LFLSYLLFSLIYCWFTKSGIASIIFILLVTTVLILPIKYLSKENTSKYLLIASIFLILPLGLPSSFKSTFLPIGYQYMSISLISSIFYLVNYLNKNSKINNSQLICKTAMAVIAPMTYFAGPSATFEEINNKSFKFALPKLEFSNLKIDLTISGFFRLSLGYLLNSFDTLAIYESFSLSSLSSIESSTYLIIIGFFNFWKYYLLFSGASELCKAFLSIFRIDVIDNFKDPEISIYYHEIWARWHLNITERIRNYLFTPMTLFALRRFSNFNKKLNYIFVEIMPTLSLFIILSIWHGARKTDFLFGFISATFTILSRLLSKQIMKNNSLSKNIFFIEISRFFSLSLFGVVLIIYDFANKISEQASEINFSFKQFLPYLILSLLVYSYYRMKINLFKDNNIFENRNKRFSILYFESVILIILNILIIPEFRTSTNFIYFAQ